MPNDRPSPTGIDANASNDDWLETAPPLETKGDNHTLDFTSPLPDRPGAESDFDFDSLLDRSENDDTGSESRDKSSRSQAFDDDTIPLDIPPAPKSPDEPEPERKCPACNLSMKASAVVCINCGFDQNEGGKIKTKVIKPTVDEDGAASKANTQKSSKQTGPSLPDIDTLPPDDDDSDVARRYRSTIAERLRDREDDARDSKFADLYLPLIFFAVGGGFLFWQGMEQDWSVAKSLANIGIDLLVKVPLIVLAVFGAAKYMDISFGPLGKAIFKLAAIGIGPMALADLLMLMIAAATMGYGIILGLCFYIILAGIPLAYMFDLDYPDTSFTLLCICLIRFLIYPMVQGFLLAGFQ